MYEQAPAPLPGMPWVNNPTVGPRLARGIGLGALVVAATAGFLLWRLGLGETAGAARSGGLVVASAALLATAGTLAAGRGGSATVRWPWLMVAVGGAVWAAARTLAALEPAAPGDDGLAVVAAGVGNAAFVLLLGAALLLLAPPTPRGDRATLALDLAIGVATLLTVVWGLALGPLWHAAAAPDAVLAIATLHGLATVALLVAGLAVALQLGHRAPETSLVALGVGAVGVAVGGGLMIARSLTEQIVAGPAAETVWIGGLLAVAAAGLLAYAADPAPAPAAWFDADPTDQDPDWRVLLPYPLIAALLGLTAWQALGAGADRFAGAWAWGLVGTLATVALVVARQGLAVRAARRLSHTLGREVGHDPLTGLLNRRRVLELIERERALGRAGGRPLAVAIIDVDNFKMVNDTLGHAAGDRLLQDLARVLADGCRGVGAAARYAGDEFVLLLPGLDAAEARAVCVRAVRQSAAAGTGTAWAAIGVGLSAGVAITRRYGRPTRHLLAIADATMYDAKEAGKGRVVVVDADTLTAAPAPRDLATYNRSRRRTDPGFIG